MPAYMPAKAGLGGADASGACHDSGAETAGGGGATPVIQSAPRPAPMSASAA